MSGMMNRMLSVFPGQMLDIPPAYFYTQPGATGPGMFDNMAPQSWQVTYFRKNSIHSRRHSEFFNSLMNAIDVHFFRMAVPSPAISMIPISKPSISLETRLPRVACCGR
jgi:hypothetical protein